MVDINKNAELEQTFNLLKENGEFDIKPCDITNIEDNPKYKKLELTSGQKMKLSLFIGQLPMIAAAGALTNAYIVKFPENLPHTLMKLGQGGVSSAIMGQTGIVGHASFYKVEMMASLLSVFTAMSFASGQYFLTQIDNKPNMINMNIDRILEFLYGDKKAELMAEVSFVRYAYQNYNSIMSNEVQRIGTISNLQAARKVALKDCEFYLHDLEKTANGCSDIISDVEESFNIKDTLEFSMNLYVTSSLLEVYYSQNFDKDYLAYNDDSEE